MEGTALGNWVARTYADQLRTLAVPFAGLTFHDPTFDPGQARIGQDCQDRTLGGGSDGKTVADAEAAGESLGLERYQAFDHASHPTPSAHHRIPLIDGAYGFSGVTEILQAIGMTLEPIPTRSKRQTVYRLIEREQETIR